MSIYSDNGHEESYDADSLQVDKQGQGSVWMKISLSDEDRVGYGKLAEMKGDADGVAKAKQTAVRKQKAVVRCDNPFVTYTITEVYDLSGELITTYNDPDHPTVMSVGPDSTEEVLYQLICGK